MKMIADVRCCILKSLCPIFQWYSDCTEKVRNILSVVKPATSNARRICFLATSCVAIGGVIALNRFQCRHHSKCVAPATLEKYVKAANIHTPFSHKRSGRTCSFQPLGLLYQKTSVCFPEAWRCSANLCGANGQTESMPHFKKVQRIDRAWYSFIPSCILSSKCLFLVQPRNKRLQWPRAFPWLSSSDLLTTETLLLLIHSTKSHTPQPSTRPHLVHQAIPPKIEAARPTFVGKFGGTKWKRVKHLPLENQWDEIFQFDFESFWNFQKCQLYIFGKSMNPLAPGPQHLGFFCFLVPYFQKTT